VAGLDPALVKDNSVNSSQLVVICSTIIRKYKEAEKLDSIENLLVVER